MARRLKIGRLTSGEQLFLNRRRAGLTQQRMAASLGVSHFDYGLAERDAYTLPSYAETPVVRASDLDEAEQCVLLRRRSGRTTLEVAEGLECSRQWLRNMEQGKAAADRLVEYWTANP